MGIEGLENLNTVPSDNAIVEAVTKEIKSMGDNTKKAYDELRKSHEQLKNVVDSLDGKYAIPSDLEQLKKLGDDITIRQDELDKANAKRMDDLEIALKRLPLGSNSTEIAPDVKDMSSFFTSALAVKNKEKGVSLHEMEAIKGIDRREEYNAYRKAFYSLIRKPGDTRALAPDEMKALTVGTDPDGGYTVTPEISNRIITRMYETDPIRQLAATEAITTGAIEWPVDWSEASCGWESETEGGSQTSTPQWSRKRIPVYPMYAKPRASQIVLEDSGIDIERWLADKVVDKMNRTEAAAFVSGNGEGKPRGFLTYSDGTTYSTVEQIAMGAASAVTADGFLNIKYALKEFFLNSGTWLMARSTVLATMLLKDGQGNYIWKPGLTNDAQATILGLPVRMSTSMPAVAASALSVALADWSQAYMIVDRIGITMQKDPYTVIPMIQFYFRKRVGADVINADALKIGVISA